MTSIIAEKKMKIVVGNEREFCFAKLKGMATAR
jgi:hypothetical protein